MTPFHPSSKTNASTPLDDLLVVTGPGDGDPDNKLLTFLVKKSGLTNSAYGDGTISIDPDNRPMEGRLGSGLSVGELK